MEGVLDQSVWLGYGLNFRRIMFRVHTGEDIYHFSEGTIPTVKLPSLIFNEHLKCFRG